MVLSGVIQCRLSLAGLAFARLLQSFKHGADGRIVTRRVVHVQGGEIDEDVERLKNKMPTAQVMKGTKEREKIEDKKIKFKCSGNRTGKEQLSSCIFHVVCT